MIWAFAVSLGVGGDGRGFPSKNQVGHSLHAIHSMHPTVSKCTILHHMSLVHYTDILCLVNNQINCDVKLAEGDPLTKMSVDD